MSRSETFPGVPLADLGTGELLAPSRLKALVDYAHEYLLDPARGHVCLMYGKPYITIDGYLFHAAWSGKPYTIASRPLKENERKEYQIPEGDHAWLSLITFTDSGSSFTGLGIVTPEEMTEESKRNPDQFAAPVVAEHPWSLAQKRAEWHALRRAFPIGKTRERANGET